MNHTPELLSTKTVRRSVKECANFSVQTSVFIPNTSNYNPPDPKSVEWVFPYWECFKNDYLVEKHNG